MTTMLSATWRGPEADVFERAEANGFGLRRYSDQDCYWLTCGHLAQPCLTLGDVEAALLLGSAWRALCARAGVPPAYTVIVAASPVVGVPPVIPAPVVTAPVTVPPVTVAPVTPHSRQPLRWKQCPHCDYVTKQPKRLNDHLKTHRAAPEAASEPEPRSTRLPTRPLTPTTTLTAGERRAMVTAAASRAGVVVRPGAPAPKSTVAAAPHIRYCTKCYLRGSVAAKDKCDNCGAPLKGN